MVKRRHLAIAALSTILVAVLAGGLYWQTSRAVIPRTWLVERVNLADVEREEWAKRSDRLGQEWKALRKQMRRGDELWYYKSPPRFLADEAGYALVRKGRPIAKVVIFMS